MRIRRTQRAAEGVAGYLFLLPFLLWLLIFFAYAFVRSVYFSFTDYNLFQPPVWTGLANYLALFREPLFLTALRNSLAFALVVTPAQTLLAFLLALVLNQKLRGILAFRSAYYMPSVTSSIVITLIFIWLYQRQGAINYLLTLGRAYGHLVLAGLALLVLFQLAQVLLERRRGLPAGWTDPVLGLSSLFLAVGAVAALVAAGVLPLARPADPVSIIWLNTTDRFPQGPISAPIPLIAIMLMNIWTTAPTFMLLYLAGLQDVPRELYEAAAVDGAKPWQQVVHITWPQLRPVTFLVLTLGLIGTLQMFDQVAIIGDQAPLQSTITLAYYVYHNAFPPGAIPRLGMASAAAVVLAVLTLCVVWLQRRVLRY
ncbi:MAG: sugar ABC transporter permease [Firmicutes bacterium]|nr:sugar ABC transporter permease [Bacillota bacterium]